MGIRYQETPVSKSSSRKAKVPRPAAADGGREARRDGVKKGRRRIKIQYVVEKTRRDNIVSKRGTGVVRKVTEYSNLGGIASLGLFYNPETGLMRLMFSKNATPDILQHVTRQVAKQTLDAQGVIVIPWQTQ
jgi:hypothetical protein